MARTRLFPDSGTWVGDNIFDACMALSLIPEGGIPDWSQVGNWKNRQGDSRSGGRLATFKRSGAFGSVWVWTRPWLLRMMTA